MFWFPNSAPDSLTPKNSNLVRFSHVSAAETGVLDVVVEVGVVSDSAGAAVEEPVLLGSRTAIPSTGFEKSKATTEATAMVTFILPVLSSKKLSPSPSPS